ncbi:hypothetical protein LWP59_18090 [Amycolatopsis acidiphila]|uniref:Uncharacterized protein n=1 Tax=Amycolatopsis acidiphila TaxID=715473 RepID=A0A558ANQ8_9PSEU|nr:hypothetical protein [Amycolatopsis acidiphila]TVT25891.1 hypothetical protein FNH06_00145 [Amycolatopsis acidiphila]UIJ63410.1 hypothetical protein LWP59_18090 [Amycolatopsis acidiphila]
MSDLPPPGDQDSAVPVRRPVATGLVWLCPSALLIGELMVTGHVRPFTVLVSLAATFAVFSRRAWGRAAAALLALADALTHAVLVPADSRWLTLVGFDVAVVIAVIMSGKPESSSET